jgi:hypothetical protein
VIAGDIEEASQLGLAKDSAFWQPIFYRERSLVVNTGARLSGGKYAYFGGGPQ